MRNDISGLRVEIRETRLDISWQYPDGSQGAYIAYSFAAPPNRDDYLSGNPSIRGHLKKRRGKELYGNFELPLQNQYFYITVFALYEDELPSEGGTGARWEKDLRKHAELRYRLFIRRNEVPLIELHCIALQDKWDDQPFSVPRLQLEIGTEKAPPTQRNSGKIIFEYPAHPVQLPWHSVCPITIGEKDLPVFARLFVGSEGGSYLEIVHPEMNELLLRRAKWFERLPNPPTIHCGEEEFTETQKGFETFAEAYYYYQKPGVSERKLHEQLAGMEWKSYQLFDALSSADARVSEASIHALNQCVGDVHVIQQDIRNFISTWLFSSTTSASTATTFIRVFLSPRSNDGQIEAHDILEAILRAEQLQSSVYAAAVQGLLHGESESHQVEYIRRWLHSVPSLDVTCQRTLLDEIAKQTTSHAATEAYSLLIEIINTPSMLIELRHSALILVANYRFDPDLDQRLTVWLDRFTGELQLSCAQAIAERLSNLATDEKIYKLFREVVEVCAGRQTPLQIVQILCQGVKMWLVRYGVDFYRALDDEFTSRASSVSPLVEGMQYHLGNRLVESVLRRPDLTVEIFDLVLDIAVSVRNPKCVPAVIDSQALAHSSTDARRKVVRLVANTRTDDLRAVELASSIMFDSDSSGAVQQDVLDAFVSLRTTQAAVLNVIQGLVLKVFSTNNLKRFELSAIRLVKLHYLWDAVPTLSVYLDPANEAFVGILETWGLLPHPLAAPQVLRLAQNTPDAIPQILAVIPNDEHYSSLRDAVQNIQLTKQCQHRIESTRSVLRELALSLGIKPPLEKEKLQHRNAELAAEIDRLNDQLSVLREQEISLRERQSKTALNMPGLQRESERLEAELKQLQGEYEELQTRIRERSNFIARLRRQRNESGMLGSEREGAERELNALRHRQREIDADIQSVRDRLAVATRAVQELQSQLDQIQAQVLRAERERQNLHEQINRQADIRNRIEVAVPEFNQLILQNEQNNKDLTTLQERAKLLSQRWQEAAVSAGESQRVAATSSRERQYRRIVEIRQRLESLMPDDDVDNTGGFRR